MTTTNLWEATKFYKKMVPESESVWLSNVLLKSALTGEDPRILVWNRLWEKVIQLFDSPKTHKEGSKLANLLASRKPPGAPIPKGGALLFRYNTLKNQGLEPGSEEWQQAWGKGKN